MWRGLIVIPGLLLVWQLAAWATGGYSYILPGPLEVMAVWWAKAPLILTHGLTTATEVLAGLAIGAALGIATALVMGSFRPAWRWVMPMLVVSQAVPVFAIAPLLVLWFGYGMASKIAMATLIIYFPVTASFFDGLRRTDPGWLDLARSMNASRRAILWRIRVPSAMPSLASGLRVATAIAPIGAVVGEWVGSSAGLGYLMQHANARMQVPLMFAALLTLAVFAVALYAAVDLLLKRALSWQAESAPAED